MLVRDEFSRKWIGRFAQRCRYFSEKPGKEDYENISSQTKTIANLEGDSPGCRIVTTGCLDDKEHRRSFETPHRSGLLLLVQESVYKS